MLIAIRISKDYLVPKVGFDHNKNINMQNEGVVLELTGQQKEAGRALRIVI